MRHGLAQLWAPGDLGCKLRKSGRKRKQNRDLTSLYLKARVFRLVQSHDSYRVRDSGQIRSESWSGTRGFFGNSAVDTALVLILIWSPQVL